MQQFDAVDVARLIVERSISDQNPVSNLQLQKVLYFLQLKWMDKHGGEPLFHDDFVAWKYGPVIEKVYRVYSVVAGQKIDDLTEIDFYARLAGRDAGNSAAITVEVADDIMTIAKEYIAMDPWALVARSHREGGAWSCAYDGGNGYGSLITKKSMIDRDAA